MKKKELTAVPPRACRKRAELSKKYMDLRFQKVIGHIENPLEKRTVRRQIATLNTLIRQHEIAGQGNK
jgi:large subunit ribosomal protein L29